jgi:hypothetical protein
MWLSEPHVLEKDKKVPCCRRRIGLPSGQTPGLPTHRVTRVPWRYAVTDPEKHFASGRVEDSRSCSQKNSQSEFFCEQDKKSTMLPQANQAVTVCKHAVCRPTA